MPQELQILEMKARTTVEHLQSESGPRLRVREKHDGAAKYMFFGPAPRAGDRLAVNHDEDVRLRYRSAGKSAQVQRVSDTQDVLTLSDPDELVIGIHGAPQTRVRLRVAEPELPDNPLDYENLFGVLFPHLLIPDSQARRPLDRYAAAADLLAEHGCNYLSYSPIAPWNQYDIGCPYERDEEGLWDLTAPSRTTRLAMRAWYWQLSRLGIAASAFPFELISTKAGRDEMWRRHPWHAENNTEALNLIDTERTEVGGIAMRYPYHWINEAWQTGTANSIGGELDRLRWLLECYVDLIQSWVPEQLRERHMLAPYLEGESKRVDIEVGARFDAAFSRGSNLAYLWGKKRFEAGDLRTERAWQQFFAQLDWAKQHNWGPDEDTPAMMRWLLPHAEHYDINILGSNDGWKRADGSRPTAVENAALWRQGRDVLGDRFMGLELKFTDLQHLTNVLPATRELVGSLER